MVKKTVALVGCGRISNRHVEAINSTDGIEISLVCDIDEQKAKTKSDHLNAAYISDLKKIKDVDVISILTPSGLHPKHVIETALHCDAKYIVCEKPISLTVREAIEMYKEVKKAGKVLLPVYQNRYNPLVEFTRKLILDGKLGKIFQFNVNVFWNRNDDYFNIDWHGTMDIDGGVLYTQASHYVDMMLYLFGSVKESKGLGGSMRGLEVEDTVSAVLKFDSGTVGSLNATVSVYRQNYQTELTLIGEKGTVRLSGTNLNTIDFWDVEGMEKPNMDFKLDHQYGKGHDTMYEYIVREQWDRFPKYEEVISGISMMERLSF